MDLFERRRNLLSGKKKVFLYRAGQTAVSNCTVVPSSLGYHFKDNYLEVALPLGSSYGKIAFQNITDLNSYKSLCVSYFVNSSNGSIRVGSATVNAMVYGNLIEGELITNQISTVKFNTNNVWKYLGISVSNALPVATFQIYEIWLEK